MDTSPAPHTATLDVVSDVICPWCYIGKRQLDRALPVLAARGLRVTVRWRPFQLNPDMPAAGVERVSYRRAKFGSTARSDRLDRQVAEAGRAVGLSIRHDRMLRTPNTVDAHRVIAAAGAAAGREGCQDAVVEALFAAYFVEGRDISDRAVLADCAAAAGMDATSVTAMLAGEAGRAEVLAADAGARAAGLSGVPAFVLERHVLFTGAVPAETMAEAILSAAKVLLAA